MKKLSLSSVLLCALALTVLSACGGGGDGGITLQQPTTAVITLATTTNSTMSANTIITGYDVLISLPAGVTVKATPDSINPAKLVTNTGVLTASGKTSDPSTLVNGVYTPAASTSPGTVKINILSASGFDAGEFGKVTCDIAAGYYPTASDFVQPTLDSATGIDNTDPLHPSSIDLTNNLTLTATAVIN